MIHWESLSRTSMCYGLLWVYFITVQGLLVQAITLRYSSSEIGVYEVQVFQAHKSPPIKFILTTSLEHSTISVKLNMAWNLILHNPSCLVSFLFLIYTHKWLSTGIANQPFLPLNLRICIAKFQHSWASDIIYHDLPY